jgi:hypothetical protein
MVFLVSSIWYGLSVCRSLPNADGSKISGADLKCYQAIVERIRSGESYYSAANYELRRTGYEIGSVFNWRLPVLALFLGHLPSPIFGPVIAALLAGAAFLSWLIVFQKNKYSNSEILLAGLLLSGPLVYSIIPGPYLMHEFWAGILILLSLAIYANGWRYTSIIAGLAALFLRELALPFVLVMLTLAFIERKRREAYIWLIGLGIFSIEFLIHWMIASKFITPADKALQGSWIAFGGWSFVLNTAQVHPFLILAPAWLTAIVLPLSILGLMAQQTPWGRRIACTAGFYMLAFMVVGRPFNLYWGLIYTFLVPFGLLHHTRILRNIFR